uniref:Uncharacterized protein n=1 Tax=Ixodes ricinus TaxID=34613 RepID=V5HCG4_IXORI
MSDLPVRGTISESDFVYRSWHCEKRQVPSRSFFRGRCLTRLRCVHERQLPFLSCSEHLGSWELPACLVSFTINISVSSINRRRAF